MSSTSEKFPIVGVGASAGGIPAMEGFFSNMPDDPGAAFVIVTHLSPERESLLNEVISRYTGMTVLIAEDDMPVLCNRVYVMPSNAILTIADGHLKLRTPSPGNRERKPIDIFLGSLAEDQGEYAVSVILSGGDADGTLGTKAIKERGGLTMAQAGDDHGPKNPEMPASAISSGIVDIAVPVEEMGAKLIAFARSFGALDMMADQDDAQSEIRRAQQEIYTILRSHSGHDFSGYKSNTFMRRVTRRLQIVQAESREAYIDLLREDGAEVANLFRDLLINVTNFFRDADAFAALERLVIPKLFEGRDADYTVRVWVPGCATGEEVYSLAILMREHMAGLQHPPRVQIFATDIDESALSVARTARYPEQLLEGLTPERKKRFFKSDGASFLLSNEVRELCIFSPHSVIRDPPFSRMDMVSCRNLLIYFGPDIQTRVLPTFHYSLKPSGYLFLGTSESIGQHGDLFSTLDKKNRIFQAREQVTVTNRLPVLIGDPRILPSDERSKSPRRVATYPLRQAVDSHVLERFSPAHVVVDAEGDVVYYSARTGKYLEPPQGAPSRQILTMARKGLRLELGAALREATSKQTTVVRENIAVDESDDRVQPLMLTVEPLAERVTREQLYLILFTPMGPARSRTEAEQQHRAAEGTADLERELRDIRERLQSTIEEYETALEELKSSNEELVSVNEEAQSTNEELEASKEEMQSLNEELSTINAELGGKVEELDRANSDLKNLFESTRIATVFLDRNLVVRNFTPTASAFFNLRTADIGRPLTELASRLDYPNLKDDIAAVFQNGEVFEQKLLRDENGKHYLFRLIPYRDDGGRIEGVVVTLVDVTSLAEAEEHQQALISELNHRVKNMLAVVISIANHTLESAQSPDQFNESLLGRLHAMSSGYTILSKTNWRDASIKDVITQGTAPFGAARFDITGDDLLMKPHQSLSVSMVIHELATNASKYGALSKPDGRIAIAWGVEDGALKLLWKEKDGPRIKPPEEDGFGLSLLRGEIGYRLGGQVETNFLPEGLEVQISFKLEG
jgi:two-component system CheB/CheR fusion protein